MIKPTAIEFLPIPSSLCEDAYRRYAYLRRDQVRQGLLNNLWDNNPGEIDRWADDGGRAP